MARKMIKSLYVRFYEGEEQLVEDMDKMFGELPSKYERGLVVKQFLNYLSGITAQQRIEMIESFYAE